MALGAVAGRRRWREGEVEGWGKRVWREGREWMANRRRVRVRRGIKRERRGWGIVVVRGRKVACCGWMDGGGGGGGGGFSLSRYLGSAL